MNIALTLSGRCNFQSNDENIVNYIKKLYLDELIENHNIDVFSHTWKSTKSDALKSLETIKNLKSLELNDENESLVEYEQLLNEKANLWEPDITGFKKVRITNLLKMTYGLKKVINQLENWETKNNKKYDLILRFRYDNFILNTNFFKYTLIGNLPNNFIAMPIKAVQLYSPEYLIGQGRTISMPGEYKSYHLNANKNEIILNNLNPAWMYERDPINHSYKNKTYVSDNFFYGNETCRKIHKIYDSLPELFSKYDFCNQAGLRKDQVCYEKIVGHFCYENKITILNQLIIDGIWRKPVPPEVLIDNIDYYYLQNKNHVDYIMNRIYQN